MGKNNKILFGLENVHIAYQGEPTAEGYATFEAPIHIAGTIGMKATGKTNTIHLAADNKVNYVSMVQNTGYEGDLENWNFGDDVLVTLMNWLMSTDGGIMETELSKSRPFALMGEVKGDENNRRFVYYNTTVEKPDDEYQTIGEKIDVKSKKLKFKSTPILLAKGLKLVKYSLPYTEENKLKYDDFFKNVPVPTEKKTV